MPYAPKTHKARMRLLEAKPRETRESASKRGYGRAWQKLRTFKLNRQPMCEANGCWRHASEVDHIVPRARGGIDSYENLQSLCKTHHSQKTAREDGGFGHKKAE